MLKRNWRNTCHRLRYVWKEATCDMRARIPEEDFSSRTNWTPPPQSAVVLREKKMAGFWTWLNNSTTPGLFVMTGRPDTMILKTLSVIYDTEELWICSFPYLQHYFSLFSSGTSVQWSKAEFKKYKMWLNRIEGIVSKSIWWLTSLRWKAWSSAVWWQLRKLWRGKNPYCSRFLFKQYIAEQIFNHRNFLLILFKWTQYTYFLKEIN